MPSVITTTDLSVEDKSELKTGNTRREYNMPKSRVCAKIKDPEKRKRCENYTGEYAVKKKSKPAMKY